MSILDFIGLSRKARIKRQYKYKRNLVSIEFANRTSVIKFIWVELTCASIELDPETEYQMLTHDTNFRIEFDEKETTTFYLGNSFGFVLNKRPTSKNIPNPNPWVLDMDISDIN